MPSLEGLLTGNSQQTGNFRQKTFVNIFQYKFIIILLLVSVFETRSNVFIDYPKDFLEYMKGFSSSSQIENKKRR